MRNPYTTPASTRAPAHSNIGVDIEPVTLGETYEIPAPLYIETGGAISIVTAAGEARTVEVADFASFPIAVSRVNAAGTTATGIHRVLI